MTPSPVTVQDIAKYLCYSLKTVEDWVYRPDQFFPPFPPARWGKSRFRFWDWNIVLAWYERTHPQRLELLLKETS